MEICLVCGELFEIITDSHCAKHGLTRDEYRLKHGRKAYNKLHIPKKNCMSEIDKYQSEAISKRKNCMY